MDFTLSQHAAEMLEERGIALRWIEGVMSSPAATTGDPSDPTVRHFLGVVEERNARVLRVVVNVTKRPPQVVTAFFDRRLRGSL